MLNEIEKVLDTVIKNQKIKNKAEFTKMIRDELSSMSTAEIDFNEISSEDLNNLYEIRARVLDWELGTGYLGFFAKNKGTRYVFIRRLEILMKQMPSLEGKSVLEVGSGAGIISLELAKYAKKVIGIDVTGTALDFGIKLSKLLNYNHVEFKKGNAEQLEFEDSSFDIIICSEVLEHLLHPKKALLEFHRVLKKEGILILTTPCAVSPSEVFLDFLRIFKKDLQVEKEYQFDKKTYLGVTNEQKKVLPKKFFRIHRRFRYSNLIEEFRNRGFEVLDSKGAVIAFPPHFQVFYRFFPSFLLPVIKKIEGFFNWIGIFQRFGSVTTCFSLRKHRKRLK